jgi:hypothetical protein
VAVFEAEGTATVVDGLLQWTEEFEGGEAQLKMQKNGRKHAGSSFSPEVASQDVMATMALPVAFLDNPQGGCGVVLEVATNRVGRVFIGSGSCHTRF